MTTLDEMTMAMKVQALEAEVAKLREALAMLVTRGSAADHEAAHAALEATK